MWYLKYILFLLIPCVKLTEGNFTFSYEMKTLCKEHICRRGYSYETYYKMDAEDRREIKKDYNIVFEMHIAILAASNGHILLSPVPQPISSDPVYEIVVGGGGNKFTELRRNLRKNAKISAKTVGILSAIEFRGFFIRISEDGHIEFFKEGEELPLLTYFDTDPLKIAYFSFAAWNGVEAKFLYDCPVPGQNSTKIPNSKEVKRKMSNSEVLRQILLEDRPATAPSAEVAIQIGARITSIRYDASKSKLTTGLALVLSWTDQSMAWSPTKFNGTTSVKFRQGEIWRPTLFAYNSDDRGEVSTKNPGVISMVYSGEATFHFQTTLNTWCIYSETGLNKWPRDSYLCTIVIGPWEPHEKFTIERMPLTSDKMKHFSGLDNVIKNEWDITARQIVVTPEAWDSIFKVNDNTTYQNDRLVMYLQLTRNATSYNIVFYTPLLVLMTFVLLSFWTNPLQMDRVWFYTGATVVVCAGLCFIEYLVPSEPLPSILVLYTTVLAGIVIALLVQVTLMTQIVKKLSEGTKMQNLLTTKLLRIVFFLPEMKGVPIYESVNDGYSQEDDDSGMGTTPRNGNIEEMESDATAYAAREELAEIIDKLMFLIYSTVFAVLLALHF